MHGRGALKARGWLVTLGLGFLVGIAPFLNIARYVPGVHDLVLLIPQGLAPLLGSLTGVLTALLALCLRGRARIGTMILRKAFRAGAAGLPAGLALLAAFQVWFVVRHSFTDWETHESTALSVVIAPPRLRECPCGPSMEDEDCIDQSSDSDFIARCWGRGAVRTNQALWSGAYLLTVAGLCSCVGFLALRGEAPEPRREEQPQPLASPERRIFLSYSRCDVDFVERLARDLQERGVPVWQDLGEIDVGDSLPLEIGAAIAGSRWFGVVLSPDAVASPWVRLEIDTALSLEVLAGAPSVRPILYRGCEVPPALSSKVYADFTVSYEEGLAALLRSVGAAESDDITGDTRVTQAPPAEPGAEADHGGSPAR